MDPQTRVQSFIADYLSAHGQVLSAHGHVISGRFDFNLWNAAVRELEAMHFTGNGGRELGCAFASESPHGPEKEPIVNVSTRGDRVYVETRTEEHGLGHWWEYELMEMAGDWKIVRIRDFLNDANEPYVGAEDKDRFESVPSSPPLGRLDQEDAGFDGDVLFEVGREITGKVGKSAIEVKLVGVMDCPTGTLVAGDLGYAADGLFPLSQQVPPGRYRVEISMAFGENLAARVKLSDRPVASWHPAQTTQGSCVIDVDAGNAAIFDVAAILGVKARDKDRAFDSFAHRVQGSTSMMLSLSSPNDAAIVESGDGDGGYPMYWGVDASGCPAILLIEFLIVSDARQRAAFSPEEKKKSGNWWKFWKR